jgi:HPt (histidine-containing phosphotransfer) domain-containing protein
MTDPAAFLAQRLAELWRSSRPVLLERMTLLHSTLDRLRQNPADAEARAAGREAAHKLSGILGVFGLPAGSRIASEIEGILIVPSDGGPDALSPAALGALRSYLADLEAVIASKPA